MKDLKLALSLGIPVKLSAEQAEELCNTVINLEQQLAKANERVEGIDILTLKIPLDIKLVPCND